MKYSLKIYLKINCFQYQKAGNSARFGLLSFYKNIKYFNLKDLERLFILLYFKKFSMRRTTNTNKNIIVRKTKVPNKVVIYIRSINQQWNHNYLQKSVFGILPYEVR